MTTAHIELLATPKGFRQTASIEPPMQLVRFEGKMQPVDEVVSILLCSGMKQPEIFSWLERRMEIGRFAR